jgi:dephospho-CoA kinase
MGSERGEAKGESAKESTARRTSVKEREKIGNDRTRKNTDDREKKLVPTPTAKTGDKWEQTVRARTSTGNAMRDTDETTTGETTTRRRHHAGKRPERDRAYDQEEQADNAEGAANGTLHDSAMPEQGESETLQANAVGIDQPGYATEDRSRRSVATPIDRTRPAREQKRAADDRADDTTKGDRSRRPRADADGVQARWKAGRSHPVIGLTGPMCAGKNVAGEILERRGFAVVDADKVAHAALVDVQSKVIAEFRDLAAERGIALVATDGSLDRRALGSLVFSDPDLLARHEAIVYPRINELLDCYIEENPNRLVVINAPLLHKSPVLDRCDFVIFIDACAPIRLFRARNRDKLPFTQIFARFSAQKHLFAQYLLKDVDIQRVWNHGNAKDLARKLMKLLFSRGY